MCWDHLKKKKTSFGFCVDFKQYSQHTFQKNDLTNGAIIWFWENSSTWSAFSLSAASSCACLFSKWDDLAEQSDWTELNSLVLIANTCIIQINKIGSCALHG